MAIPASPLSPGDDGYDEVYEYWEKAGRPGAMDKLSEGWLRRVYFPDGPDSPVFVLECSHPDFAKVMGTYQKSWQGGKSLPIENV